jgi:hypothetical protein
VSRLSRRRGAAWAVAASVTAACLASCSSAVSTSGGSGGSTGGSGPAPLATSVNTADGTWATVAMGHLDDPANTFWQLLHRAAGAGLWTDQIRATAVATNGGLVMAPSQGGSLVVGVLPFDFLTFSPLVATANGGRSWSNGLLPGGLVTAPNALAANANGQALAITGKDQSASSQMVLTSASLANWQPVASASALASSADGQQCGIAGLSAVAFDGPDPVVGVRCSHPGVIGLFEKKGSAWALIGPRPPAGTSQDDFAVNAVQAAGQGFSGLLSASGSRGTSVMVVSTDDAGQIWQVSQPLQLTTSERIASVGPAGGGGFFVLLDSPTGPGRAAVLADPQTTWQVLPAPPPGTATLAFGPGTTVEALAVDTATLTVWTLEASGSWHEGQVMTVSIDYGSSS